jgi:hypothetical protein
LGAVATEQRTACPTATMMTAGLAKDGDSADLPCIIVWWRYISATSPGFPPP